LKLNHRTTGIAREVREKRGRGGEKGGEKGKGRRKKGKEKMEGRAEEMEYKIRICGTRSYSKTLSVKSCTVIVYVKQVRSIFVPPRNHRAHGETITLVTVHHVG
jgi:hypothetical protein